MTKTTAAERLHQATLKVTKPRLALLDVLMTQHGPFTMEELHKRVSKDVRCDLATVYRCLDSFQKASLVRRVDFGDGTVRFEFSEEGGHHHHHIVCRGCNEVKVLEHCVVEDIERIVESQGYKQITHSLEFFALCAKCSR